MSSTIFHGDCLQVLPTLPADAFDALVTDPPASIGFMGQAWDGDRGGRRQWVSWLAQVMGEALRVLKPGAHGLVWAIPRRSHWTAWALEDAGFEIRDCLHHYFCQGFPKGTLEVGKAIDKKLGTKRKVTGRKQIQDIRGRNGYAPGKKGKPMMDYEITEPTSDFAKEWDGWSTGLKPAIEHWWLVRKPLEGTVVENVLKWGTGALNIDASRIPLHHYKMDRQSYYQSWEERHESDFFTTMNAKARPKSQTGWNYQYDRKEGTVWGEVFGKVKGWKGVPQQEWIGGFPHWGSEKDWKEGNPKPRDPHPDSRYPSHFIVSEWGLLGEHSGFFHPPIYSPKARKCRGEGNYHPTVKPAELMKYFITMLTRPGGSVLDCFAGSFTTGVAAQQLGMDFTGIELDAKYVQIGVRRLSA
jgi:site-specific DNA-methyltransferase (adenine-specific)